MIPVTPWRVSTYSYANGSCVEVTGWRASLHSFNINCIEVAGWRASSASIPQGNCTEVAGCACGVAIRDSKDRGGAVLLVPPAAWTAFTAALK